MPVHIHPYLKNKELAEEAAGLITTINSDGYNVRQAQEDQGLVAKAIPVAQTFLYNGTSRKSDK